MVGNLSDIKMRNLIAKFELCSFNTKGAFQVTDGQLDRRRHQKIILLWSYVFRCFHNLKGKEKFLK